MELHQEGSAPAACPALPAKYANSVDLKDGLLNNRVCTVKIPAKESYFSRNTTHTEVPVKGAPAPRQVKKLSNAPS